MTTRINNDRAWRSCPLETVQCSSETIQCCLILSDPPGPQQQPGRCLGHVYHCRQTVYFLSTRSSASWALSLPVRHCHLLISLFKVVKHYCRLGLQIPLCVILAIMVTLYTSQDASTVFYATATRSASVHQTVQHRSKSFDLAQHII